ncbi:olfactory receptor 14A16-like [Pantherophis guttatus]|uniref:Olfactory receptor n=1 Tax=Pantherophis guttatus TaxID=94885 RepID=A0A6P9CHM0_PANGU|nr:olfactory receptor 14A16-like [Pantherophis guttatus]
MSKKLLVGNQTSLTTFWLLEFSAIRELQILHCFVFLAFYFTTATANLLIILAVTFDHHLHIPMYFFLMNLAMLDLASVSVIMPKSIANSFMNTRYISYSGCISQALLFVSFLTSDFFLLTVMAYDRYVAICNPLQYEMVMNRRTCAQMIASVWISGFFFGILHTIGTFTVPFCSDAVDQFFCEIPQLLKLNCSDFNQGEVGILAFSIIVVLGLFIFILVSYIKILSAVFKIPSTQGRQKALSTCLPHLIVVSVLMFTGTLTYMKFPSNSPSNLDIMLTVTYSLVPPILNPLVYSMRNKDIKTALFKLLDPKFNSKHSFPISPF